jgi:hypothetical protein
MYIHTHACMCVMNKGRQATESQRKRSDTTFTAFHVEHTRVYAYALHTYVYAYIIYIYIYVCIYLLFFFVLYIYIYIYIGRTKVLTHFRPTLAKDVA